MSPNIFCPRCGTTIANNSNVCKCGYTLSIAEKNELSKKIEQLDSLVFINDEPMIVANIVSESLKKFKLSGTYLFSSSAKEDYSKKATFIQKELIPSINNWKDVIQAAENQLARDKVEVYGRILKITDFVLKEFYGPAKIKENGLLEFVDFKDFSKYELMETMINSDLDFSDIETTNFGSIGINIMGKVEETLKTGSFLELSNKPEWSRSDVNKVKGELGVAIASELISGVTNLVGQNRQAIKSVREADRMLNEKIKTVSTVISSLHIEQEELKKQKKLFDKSDVILDTCFEKILKPIVEELNNDEVYLEYRRTRQPYDLQQRKINLDKKILEKETKVGFWDCLLRTSKSNFNKHWTKRELNDTSFTDYRNLNSALKEKNHKTLRECNNYAIEKTNEFMDFEKRVRPHLKIRPAIINNEATVKSFIQVFRNVKNNLNPI